MNGAAITPALYAFAETFAQRVILERRQFLRQFLEKEPTIYETAFKFYVFSLQNGVSRDLSHRWFAALLRDNGIVNGDEDGVRELSRPVHDEYWRMAQSDRYWKPDSPRNPDSLESFPTVAKAWRDHEYKLLANKNELLRRLQLTLTS